MGVEDLWCFGVRVDWVGHMAGSAGLGMPGMGGVGQVCWPGPLGATTGFRAMILIDSGLTGQAGMWGLIRT